MTNTGNLFELVYILMEKKRTTATELSLHFGVSSRTIYRWIDSLCVAGIPVYTTKGNGGGIYIDENYALDKTVLNEEEKLTVLASLKALQNLTGSTNSSESSAVRKLQQLSKANTDWLEVDFGSWNPLGDYIRTVFDILKNAIIHKNIVQFEYFSMKGENVLRTVHPWKIVFKGQAWYLYGWCELRKEPRYFKLNRIQNLTQTGKLISDELRTKVQSGKERQDYYGDSSDSEGNIKTVTLVIQVSPENVYRILDEYKIDKEERQSDGSSILTFQVPDLYWIISWLLGFGSGIKVLKPEKIRLQFEEEVEKMYRKLNLLQK